MEQIRCFCCCCCCYNYVYFSEYYPRLGQMPFPSPNHQCQWHFYDTKENPQVVNWTDLRADNICVHHLFHACNTMYRRVHRKIIQVRVLVYEQVCKAGCPLFFNIEFPRLFHDPNMKIHNLSAQHIFPSKRYTTYECIPELVVTVPSPRSTIVK